jgi:hypothetical protein
LIRRSSITILGWVLDRYLQESYIRMHSAFLKFEHFYKLAHAMYCGSTASKPSRIFKKLDAACMHGIG